MPSKILGPPVQLKSLLEQLERICVGDISSIDSNLTANVTLGLSHRTSIHSSRPLSATRAPKVRLLPRSAEENRYTRIPVLLLSGLLSERTLKKNLFCFTRCFEPLEVSRFSPVCRMFSSNPTTTQAILQAARGICTFILVQQHLQHYYN